MPQASSELNEEWDGPGDETAIRYLQDAGYWLTPRREWVMPWGRHDPTPKASSAIRFLIDEWDFGGIVS